MNRRGFLSLLGLGTAGMVLDPEQLLWRPGAKKIFLPAAQGITFRKEAFDECFKDDELGISIRYMREYRPDGRTNAQFDVLYGWRNLKPDHFARVVNA